MPELPEVETIRRQLAEEIIGYKIVGLWTDSEKQVRPNPKEFLQEVKDTEIKSIKRRAKLLVFKVIDGKEEPKYFAVHLKLTGRLFLRDSSAPPDDYVHVILSLKNGKLVSAKKLATKTSKLMPHSDQGLELRFSDSRKFGYFQLVPNKQKLNKLLSNFGPEPLDDLSLQDFAKILGSTARKIKVVLLDQKQIAGVGNIYANDALWLAKIHPECQAKLLTSTEVKKLYQALRQVLTEGLRDEGTSDQWYRKIHGEKGRYQNHFKVYSRKNQPCWRHPIQKILYKKVAQRGTFWCPECQKLEVGG